MNVPRERDAEAVEYYLHIALMTHCLLCAGGARDVHISRALARGGLRQIGRRLQIWQRRLSNLAETHAAIAFQTHLHKVPLKAVEQMQLRSTDFSVVGPAPSFR